MLMCLHHLRHTILHVDLFCVLRNDSYKATQLIKKEAKRYKDHHSKSSHNIKAISKRKKEKNLSLVVYLVIKPILDYCLTEYKI